MELADVLSGDAGLARLQWLLVDQTPRRALRRELANMLDDSRVLGHCRLERVKFKPGRKLTTYFQVDLRAPGDRLVERRPLAVTWTAEGSEPDWLLTHTSAELEAEAVARGLAPPFRSLKGAVPGWGMHVLVAPLDVRFPHLARLCDPYFLAGVVNGPVCRVTAIRYRPGQRHVLRYDVARRDGSEETVYAKLYQDERGKRTYELATRIADWLTTIGARGTAVRPLVYLPDSRAVLYPALAGVALTHSLAHRNGGTRELQSAGALLGLLHCAPPALAERRERYELADEVSAVARASEHVQVLLPAGASRIASILARSQELHDRLPQERPTLAHGDFKLDHLWPGPEGLTLIDLDRCCLADPALDVGKLLADLHWWHLMSGRTGLRQSQQDFLDGYGAVASSPRVLRARLFEAILLVKVAARRVALFDRRWRLLTEDLIGRAETALADLEHACRARRPSRKAASRRRPEVSSAPPVTHAQ
jgi:aminoglycoside phosphotransferase (APT) family kinase protein